MLFGCGAQLAVAAIDAYPFPDDTMAARYDALIAELRCPQCLNTNLAGSDAMIAQDLRREVHRLLMEQKSDQQILDFMYERYGDFILYRPRVSVATALLWFSPLFFLLLAAVVWFRMANRVSVTRALSAEEQARLDQLFTDPDDQ
jgi:cytochrome c-type biogenesis protein CcmH